MARGSDPALGARVRVAVEDRHQAVRDEHRVEHHELKREEERR